MSANVCQWICPKCSAEYMRMPNNVKRLMCPKCHVDMNPACSLIAARIARQRAMPVRPEVEL